jgi:hypothetical protein
MKKDHRGIKLASKPSGDGCVECLASPSQELKASIQNCRASETNHPATIATVIQPENDSPDSWTMVSPLIGTCPQSLG